MTNLTFTSNVPLLLLILPSEEKPDSTELRFRLRVGNGKTMDDPFSPRGSTTQNP